MRRPLLLFAVLSLLSACNDTTAPRVFSSVGTWRSVGFPGALIQMTLVETARATTGAGRWVTPGDALGFRVTGAHVDRDVSLLLDFDGRGDITFEGRFRTEERDRDEVTLMSGRLYGGGMRGDTIDFERVVRDED